MITLGLTGSIGMGKSTTAAMFRDRGVPVWDADQTVHDLYGAGGAGAQAIAELYPQAASKNGVDRGKLREVIAQDTSALKKIENAIHPLVFANRAAFLAQNKGAEIVLCDIPLLFETGADRWLDKVAVVSTDPAHQRARVLERPDMTEEHFEFVLSKQTPDTEKRARADFVIDTTTLDSAARDVEHVLTTLKGANDA